MHFSKIIYFAVGIVIVADYYVMAEKRCADKDDGDKIIGGSKARPGQFPWQVYVENEGSICGGTIVSAQHVVTARHCILKGKSNKTQDHNKIMVYAGILDRTKENGPTVQHHPIKAVIHHPDWNQARTLNEIVVLVMAQEYKFDKYVRAIDYGRPGDNIAMNDPITVSGWGTIDIYGQEGTLLNELRWTKLRVAKCGRHRNAVTFCGRGPNGENVCSGDSGGPAICIEKRSGIKYLCGFSSMSECDQGVGYFTQMSHFESFMNTSLHIK